MRKVRPGEPLHISADTFNTFVDAADAYRRGMMSLPGADSTSPGATGQVVVVRNASGADQDRFAILSIDGVVISPADNLRAFQSRPTFAAGLATPESAKPVVLQEPVASGRFGRALVAGVSAVRINMTDEAHTYAKPTSGDANKLTSDGTTGPFRILYAESGTGTKWAVVQWPVGGGSALALKIAIFDAGWTGGCYSGHLVNDNGALEDAIQWIFFNDPGVAPLMTADELVFVQKAPAGLQGDPIYTGEGEKYVGILSPWGAFA